MQRGNGPMSKLARVQAALASSTDAEVAELLELANA